MKAGTTYFMAPEVIQSTHYDNKCDVYSFSIIMYQVFYQVEDKQIYPEDKLDGKNIEFILSIDKNFRPIIKEEKEEFKEFLSYFFFF
jgi:serine/threonine protein kinase